MYENEPIFKSPEVKLNYKQNQGGANNRTSNICDEDREVPVNPLA